MFSASHTPQLRASEDESSKAVAGTETPRVAVALLGSDGRLLATSLPSVDVSPDPIEIHLRRRRDRTLETAVLTASPYRERRLVATGTHTAALDVVGTPLKDVEGDVVAVVERIEDAASVAPDPERERIRGAVENLAHDVNNPLAAILGIVEVLRLDERGLDLRTELESILDQVGRIQRGVTRARHTLLDE